MPCIFITNSDFWVFFGVWRVKPTDNLRRTKSLADFGVRMSGPSPQGMCPESYKSFLFPRTLIKYLNVLQDSGELELNSEGNQTI